MFADRNRVQALRETFPVGCRIALDRMEEDPRPVPSGIRGTVLHVDDIGTVHCRFENGRLLGLVPGEDLFHRVREREIDER